MPRNQERKAINYLRNYGASEIAVGRRIGQFPVHEADYSKAELHALAEHKGQPIQ